MSARHKSSKNSESSALTAKETESIEEQTSELAKAAAAVARNKENAAKAAAEKLARKQVKERKKAIKSLRLSDSKARKLLDMIDIGVAFHDVIKDNQGATVDYRLREVNQAFEETLELSAHEVIGSPASQIYGRRGQAPFLKNIATAMESGEAQGFEGSVKSTKGRLRFSIQPMDKDLFALTIEDASQEAKSRRRLAFLETRLKNLGEEHKKLGDELSEATARETQAQRTIKALQKELATAAKENASLAALLQRETSKTQRLEAAVEVATAVRDNLKALTGDLTEGLKAR